MAPTSKDLYKQANGFLESAKSLQASLPIAAEGKDLTDEQVTQAKGIYDQINAKMGKFDELKAQADILARTEGAQQYMDEPADTPPAVNTSWRDSGPGEGKTDVDESAWRELKAFDQWGRERTVRYNVPKAVDSKEYGFAFDAYLRKGYANLGPNDRKTLTEGTDTAGGFLVAPDYHAELIKKIAGLTAIRPLARVVQVSRDVATWPRVNYTTDNKYTSPIKLTWTGESPASSTTARVTDPTFGVINVAIKTAMASLPLSNDLIEDASFDLLGVSSDLFAEGFALAEDDAFINGPASGQTGPQPSGILATVDDSAATGPASVAAATTNALAGADIIKTYYALPAQYRRAAQWIMASSTMQVVELLTDAQNRYLVSSLVNGSLATPQFDVLKGKPVNIDEFVPAVTTGAYPVLFGDWSSYLIADRVGFSIQRLTELYAETNITLLLARRRVGGQLVAPWAVKVLKT